MLYLTITYHLNTIGQRRPAVGARKFVIQNDKYFRKYKNINLQIFSENCTPSNSKGCGGIRMIITSSKKQIPSISRHFYM